MWLSLGILTNKTRQQGIKVNADIIALSYTVTMSHVSYAEMFCHIACSENKNVQKLSLKDSLYISLLNVKYQKI